MNKYGDFHIGSPKILESCISKLENEHQSAVFPRSAKFKKKKKKKKKQYVLLYKYIYFI